jgi:hypothetical protein
MTDREDQEPTKKDQILTMHAAGLGDVDDLAMMTDSRPSYVASVLQEAGLLEGYFDLYTTTGEPMNIYSKFFANRLGFRDVATAEASVGLIDQFHRQFERVGDRAGQHHALVMAMTMFDRARWTGKTAEADVFRRWLLDRLEEAAGEAAPGTASDSDRVDPER